MNNEKWITENASAATAQGWELHTFWNPPKQRLEAEIFKDDHSSIFLTDEAARAFVAARMAKGDALASKAARIAFNSKIGGMK